MNRVAFNILAACALATAVQSAPEIVIMPTVNPFEASASSALEMDFYVDVQDENGDTVALTEARSLAVEIAGWNDQESGLSVAEEDGTWNLPVGFTAGRRSISVAVTGTPPDEIVTAELTLTVTEQGGNPENVAFSVQFRRGADEFSRGIDFCVAPGQGSEVSVYNTYSSEVHLYRDFGEVRAIGTISANSGPADTVADEFSLQIFETIDDEDVATTALEMTNVEFMAMDMDENGVAEFVSTTFMLAAPDVIDVAPDDTRVFNLYAYRTDLAEQYHLAEVRIEPRESWSLSRFWLQDVEKRVFFDIDESQPLGNPESRLYVNNVLLPQNCQVTATVEPSGANDYADPQTGLYDLDWTVVVDFETLLARTTIVEGDEVRVDLTFPGTTQRTITARETVPGAEYSGFQDIDDLEDEEYDNGKTEKDYLDELLDALKDAGVVIGEDGVSFPGGFVDPDLSDPNWADIREKLKALRDALQDYKDAERKKDGENSDEIKIDIYIEVDGVLIRVVIHKAKPGRKAKASDDERHPDEDADNEDAPRVVIALGGDGEDSTPGQDGKDGGDAEVDLEKKGGLGVAVGGQGGQGGEGDPNPDSEKGGDGGGAEVDVDAMGDDSGNNGPDAIALGGHGGGSNGEGGSGGGADAKAEQGSDARIGAEGGGTDTDWPPQGHPGQKLPPKTGNAEVDNEDSINDGQEAETGSVAHNGASGKSSAGIAVAEPGQAADSTSPQPPRSGNTTPSGD